MKEWICKGTDDTKFSCKWCKVTDLNLSNSGRKAVVSHMNTAKHKATKNLKHQIKNFFAKHGSSTQTSSHQTFSDSSSSSSSLLASSQQPTISESSSSQSSSVASSQQPTLLGSSSSSLTLASSQENQPSTSKQLQQSTITGSLKNSRSYRAEIIWVLNIVMKNQSNNSSKDSNQMFKSMFPDSVVAANFSCGPDKVKYLTNHGIAPWVKEKLIEQVDMSSLIVIGFDESLNKVTQTCQMDLHVRFWDPIDNLVKVRYYDTRFLGHSAHIDLVNNYKNATSAISLSKILQISMDGPHVNIKFYDCMVNDREAAAVGTKMIDIGSCGLHIVHGAFKTAFEATDWGMNFEGKLHNSSMITSA